MWSTDSLASIKLADLDAICTVLGCEVGELLPRAR
ncbi:helix-turn-helix domain-containing protein [Rhodococcus sp. T2V]|nr:helix-turn-helix domain-containing protein [Rhodococcus sp. T2V]MDF3313802.1 helix-turn-helix domain-containing protein [Rhodococcus sp. T2V]